MSTAKNVLNSINKQLIKEHIIADGVVVTSKKGVPYLWLSHHELDISICYFGKSNSFKIWEGVGTPNNVKLAEVKKIDNVIDIVKEILKGGGEVR